MNQALDHLKRDLVLAGLIRNHKVPKWSKSKNLFASLCAEIIGQQLSGRARDVLYERLVKSFGASGFPTARQILKKSDQEIRDVGLSWAKVKYLKNLSFAVVAGQVDFSEIKKLPDDVVSQKLTAVKGIGPWTAEMFLMFTLGRPDVFSIGDLGIRKAISKLYNVRSGNHKKMIQIAENWRPYRSLACRYLWASLDE